jgi:hypothetical protein
MKNYYFKAFLAKTSLCALLATGWAQAQNNYTVESIPYQVYGTSQPFQATSDDSNSAAFTIPFDFTFFGNTYNQFVVSTNGYIEFNIQQANSASPWAFNTTIPDVAFPVKNAILGCYHDMYTGNPSGTTGTITWSVTGNAPYRQFVLMYNNQSQFSCGSNAISTFQIIIYETYNYIDVQITQKDLCGQWNQGNAVVGIIDTLGTTALAAPGRNTGAWEVTAGEGWRFKPESYPVYKYTKCDTDGDGFETFDLAIAQGDLSPSAVFYSTQQDAEAETNAITATAYTNANASQPTTIYARYNGQVMPVVLSMVDCSQAFDNDSVPTTAEDLNNDGNLANDDTDGDGLPNFIDNDDDGDMIITYEEYVFGKGISSTLDTDNDGIANYLDNDDDGDGILTINEGTVDTDGDLIMDYLDTDDDGDGVLTIDEDYNHNGDLTDDDANSNGIPDYLDNSVALSVTANTLEKGISLYPNPVAGILNIANHTGLEISDISVYSVNGVKVKQVKTSSALMVSDLQSGLYIVKIQVDNQVLNYKFVKK